MQRTEIDLVTGETRVVQVPDEEITAFHAALDVDVQLQQQMRDALPYNEKRAMEYPPLTDYLDGVVKGDQAQIDKYIADCLAVKAKYPKTEG